MSKAQAQAKMDEAAGCCKKTVVSGLDKTVALVLLVLNIIWPGLGTAISSCLAPAFLCPALLHGFLQAITSWLIVGWIWSIIHGVWLVKAAK